jgi:hypothetical protein
MIKWMIKAHPILHRIRLPSSSKVALGKAVRCVGRRSSPWWPSGMARPGRRCQACCGTGLDGSSSAAPMPMSPITAREAIASA